MIIQRLFRPYRLATLLFPLYILLGAPVHAATLPAGFSEALVAGGLSSPTAMQFSPDGRLFVCEQGGRLRVIKNGSLLPAPFVALTVDSGGERGLLGVAFDPAFATNGYVYVYYTARTPVAHNRISRFTANGDVAVAGSEVVLFDLDNLSSASNHNGGALAFGPDGKLYAAVGENGNSANAQSMGNVLGKILRLNPDGSIPTDNPFFSTASGKNRAIWALGLRNPFTFAFNPFGGELFINDVGETTWEEINDGIAGANYGWPTTEGPTTNPAFRSPRHAYNHSSGGCAITGGAFYSPVTGQFPADYLNDYFFADYCGGWIRKIDPASGTVTTFATGIGAPVDLKVSDDGSLYYLSIGDGAVYQVRYAATAPTITSHPSNLTVAPGASATFHVQASGAPPLQYQWLRNGVNIAGATAPDYTIASVAASDDGARFRARVSNSANNVLSNEATLTVSTNQAPTGTITQPVAGTLYSGGTVISYAGTANDPEDGTLPASAYTWQVDFHHDTHVHPFMPATTGAQNGTFTIPNSGETAANVWYRLYLTVRDSAGAVHTTQRDILPRKVVLTLATSPAGLQLKLDGQPVTSPLSFDAVVGIARTIEATTPQSQGSTSYTFTSWSDGGAASHAISTPATNTTYTATYQGSTQLAPPPPTLVQHAGLDAGTTTASPLAFPSANTAGNWIGVAIRAGRSGQTFTVTDTRGNTYRKAVQVNETVDDTSLAIYYAENIAGGANTVTVSNSWSGTLRFAIVEYSGIAASGSLDGTASAQGNSANPSSGNATTTASGDLVIGVVSTANARTFTAGSGFAIQERVPAPPSSKLILEDRVQTTAGPVAAGATLNSADVWGAVVAAFRTGSAGPPPPPPPQPPDLTLTKTHAGSFTQGQNGATYTLTVANAGTGPTSGQVTLNDTLPGGLTATALAGSGWACTLAPLACTRSDALAAGNSYPAVTLTVNVASNAPANVTNTASVSGGGDVSTGNNAASDPTSITPVSGPDAQPPTAPGSLTATPAGSSQVNLNWTPSTDNVGVTTYRVEQCAGASCTNFSEIGTVAAGGPITAPLTASANPNYFKDASGTPIILNGSHTWNNFQDWGTNGTLHALDFPAYVNFLVAHGHNITYLWRTELPKFCGFPTKDTGGPTFTVGPHPWQRTGPGTATDGAAKFDLTKFDQGYFDRLRTRVAALNDAGIYAGVYLFSGEWVEDFRCANDGYPFTGANNVNGIDDGGGIGSMTMNAPNAITALQDAYVKKMIDTLNDLPNVLWLVSEEAPGNSIWWNKHHIAHARSYEAGKPLRHPIGWGMLGDFNEAVLYDSDADFINPGSTPSPTTSCGNGTPTCKVNINDSDHSYYGMWNDSAQTNRVFAWRNFTNGNQVMFMDPYVVYYPRQGRNPCASPVNDVCDAPDPRWDNFRDNLGYILDYSRRLNLANVTPRASLCSTNNCLAQTPAVGAEYLVYAPNGGAFTVNLSAMSSSRTLNVEWFNPSTGVTTVASPVPAGSTSRSFTPPFSGDAVLYLVDSAGHAGSAAAPSTSYNVTGLSAGTYRYRIRATDAAGNMGPYSSIASASIAASDTQPPTAPAGLTATAISSSQVNLGWTASTDNVAVTQYRIERCQGAGCSTFATVATVTGTSHGDTGLASSTSFTYRVRALDAAGNVSSPSNVASATTSAAPPPAAISLRQHTGKDAGTTLSSSLAFPSANTTGNWIGVAIRGGGSGQTFTVTDTRGNTYRKAVQLNETVDWTSVAIYYAENIAGGANTVTVSNSSSGTLRFAIVEYAGVATSGSLDATASAQGNSATPSSGNATTTANGDLVIGVLSTANPRTFTAGSGFIVQERVPAPPDSKLLVEDRVQTAAGPAAAGATLNSADVWGAVVAAFRAAAAP